MLAKSFLMGRGCRELKEARSSGRRGRCAEPTRRTAEQPLRAAQRVRPIHRSHRTHLIRFSSSEVYVALQHSNASCYSALCIISTITELLLKSYSNPRHGARHLRLLALVQT